MNVLITGGTGLIGSALSQNLIEGGHDVTVLTRKMTDVKAGGINFVQWDAQTTDGILEAMEAADAVVHLAGANLADGRWTDERKKRIESSRVTTGHALVAAIEQVSNRPRVLVQSSAIGYYGPHENEVLDENAEPGDDYLSQLCVRWEAATAPVENLGIRRAVARTGIVLSMEGGALPRIVLPFKFFGGGRIGSGKQWWSWIHLDDQVRALRFLIENENATGAFNLTAPNPVTNQEFASTVGSVTGRPSLLPVPAPALSALFGEMSTVLLDGQRVVPDHLWSLGFKFNYPELEGALKDLLS